MRTPIWRTCIVPRLCIRKIHFQFMFRSFAFHCLRHWIIREGIVYFQMYRRLYILNCMQCIAMIQLNMQIFAVCKSDILQKQS
jgi:hypothetical protein